MLNSAAENKKTSSGHACIEYHAIWFVYDHYYRTLTEVVASCW